MRRTLAAAVFACLALPSSASAFTVNVIGDGAPDACDASCTLRDAMTLADSTPGADVIDFAIPGAGTHQISPSSALPPITEQVSIDGTTQPGWTQDALVIEIDGAVTGAGDGFFVNGASNVHIEGIAINNFDDSGIRTSAASSGATIVGNFIGTGFDGTATGSGNDGNGIDLDGDNHVVGGTTAADRNVIGGNGLAPLFSTHGIKVTGDNNTIIGNHVGVDRAGLSPIPNLTNGIQIDGSDNVVGGSAAGQRNVISGNDTFGIGLGGGGSQNTIRGNYIGVGSDGSTAIPQGAGVSPQGSFDNDIGGLGPGEGNVISGNSGIGVFLDDPTTDQNSITGNLIGTDATGTLAVGNATTGVHISAGDNNSVGANTIANNGSNGVTLEGGQGNYVSINKIRDNGGLGISLKSNTTQEPNDAGDADSGPNGLQNYPIIRSIVINGGTATVTGTLNSTPSSLFFIEGFKSATCDPSGFGEGGQFIGQDTVVNTNAAGNATFQFTASGITAADVLTVVAFGTALGNGSSEFSPCGAQALPPAAGGSAATPSVQTLPPPVVRKTANVAVVKGTVKVKQPGQRSFRNLTSPAQIRIGSIIDATNGRVRITTAAGGGKTQTAEFYDGIFKITQTKGKKPITDLTLVGKLAGCKKGKRASAAARKRKGRRLWGSGKGRFRTKGKRSSALVRGTIWLVEDRCNDTTLTRVRRGVVQVRDFGRKRNIIVRAPRSYVAKPRRR